MSVQPGYNTSIPATLPPEADAFDPTTHGATKTDFWMTDPAAASGKPPASADTHDAPSTHGSTAWPPANFKPVARYAQAVAREVVLIKGMEIPEEFTGGARIGDFSFSEDFTKFAAVDHDHQLQTGSAPTNGKIVLGDIAVEISTVSGPQSTERTLAFSRGDSVVAKQTMRISTDPSDAAEVFDDVSNGLGEARDAVAEARKQLERMAPNMHPRQQPGPGRPSSHDQIDRQVEKSEEALERGVTGFIGSVFRFMEKVFGFVGVQLDEVGDELEQESKNSQGNSPQVTSQVRVSHGTSFSTDDADADNEQVFVGVKQITASAGLSDVNLSVSRDQRTHVQGARSDAKLVGDKLEIDRLDGDLAVPEGVELHLSSRFAAFNGQVNSPGSIDTKTGSISIEVPASLEIQAASRGEVQVPSVNAHSTSTRGVMHLTSRLGDINVQELRP